MQPMQRKGTRWRDTGFAQLVESDQQTRAMQIMEEELARARRTGSHYWLAMVAFKVEPPMVDRSILDVENLRQFPVVGCFLCEEPYSERLALRRCRPVPS